MVVDLYVYVCVYIVFPTSCGSGSFPGYSREIDSHGKGPEAPGFIRNY